MGWSGGTGVFDSALDVFLPYIHEDLHQALIEKWYEKFSGTDWDTEEESAYWEQLEPVMRKKYPHLFDEE